MKQKEVKRSQVADKLFRQLRRMACAAAGNLRDIYIPQVSSPEEEEKLKFMFLEYRRVEYALSQIVARAKYDLRTSDFTQFTGKIRKIFLEICLKLDDISHELPAYLSSSKVTGGVYDQDWLKKIIKKLEQRWR
jgi:hypothetical protein